jgi:hypothetical protein
LIPTGFNPALLALPVCVSHYGRLKYDPALARFWWTVNFFVGLVTKAVTHWISSRLDSHLLPNWTDAAATKAWLLDTKANAEKVLESTGVTAALKVAKSWARKAELAVTFLWTVMSLSQGGSKNDYKRHAGQKTDAGTEARATQLNVILVHTHLLDSIDLPLDPNHLAPYTHHPILSDIFPEWLMGLKADIQIM